MCFELCLLFVAAAMSTCGQNMERDFETKRAQFEQLLPRQNELRRKVDQAEREQTSCRNRNRGTRSLVQLRCWRRARKWRPSSRHLTCVAACAAVIESAVEQKSNAEFQAAEHEAMSKLRTTTAYMPDAVCSALKQRYHAAVEQMDKNRKQLAQVVTASSRPPE